MSKELTPSLTLNTITGPYVSRPSLSPDTLKRFNQPYYSFLQTYCLKNGNKKWYGRLSNFGLQHPVPLMMVLPVEVSQLLELENRDSIKVELSQIGAADTVHYDIIGTIDHIGSNLRPIIPGVGLEIGQEYEYNGNQIRIAIIDPEQSFYDKTTQMEELSNPGHEDEDWVQVFEVQTGLESPTPDPKTETETFEDITEEHK